MDLLTGAWPWYVSGPLLGLMVPALLFFGNKHFGISSSFRHICAAALPLKADYFTYNWKDSRWSLSLVLGVIVGGGIAVLFLNGGQAPELSVKARAMFAEWGLTDFSGLQPANRLGICMQLLPISTQLLIPEQADISKDQ